MGRTSNRFRSGLRRSAGTAYGMKSPMPNRRRPRPIRKLGCSLRPPWPCAGIVAAGCANRRPDCLHGWSARLDGLTLGVVVLPGDCRDKVWLVGFLLFHFSTFLDSSCLRKNSSRFLANSSLRLRSSSSRTSFVGGVSVKTMIVFV